jgi:1,4-alpha-glucan branching enzyme
MIKRGAGHGRVQVTFEVNEAVQADRANLCGDFNDWSSDATPMERRNPGGFSVTLELDAGRAYRFRYLLDGHRWENDWAADDYVRNEYGGDDSVVDLTKVVEEPPAVKAAAPAKKATAKKADGKKAPAKKAAAKKATAKKAAKKATKKLPPPENPGGGEPPNPGI